MCCSSAPFYAYLALSVLTYAGELGLGCWAAADLYGRDQLEWFSVAVGLLVVPVIASQLLSLLLLSSSRAGRGVVAVHVLLGAVPWRHLRLAAGQRQALTQRDLGDTFTVRLAHTFTGTLPSLLLHTYLTVYDQAPGSYELRSPCIAAAAGALLSATWALAAHRKGRHFCCVLGAALPLSTLSCKAVWRAGEVTARTCTLALFATYHHYWVFLVLGMHEVTMILLLIMARALKSQDKNQDQKKTAGQIVLAAYLYLYCYLNPKYKKSKSEFAMYHVIIFLESVTMLILWVIYDKNTSSHLPLVLVVAISYFVGWIGAILYYTCFYRSRDLSETSEDNAVCLYQCLNCKLAASGKQNLHFQSPYHASLVHIQDNPNPKYFDLFHPSDSETTMKTYTDMSSIGSERPVYSHRGRRLRHQKRSKQRNLNIDSGARVVTQQAATARVSDIGLHDLSDLAWDNYDLQITPGTDPDATDTKNPGRNRESQNQAVKKQSPRGGFPDQGYHSANSSSRDNVQLNGAELLAHTNELLRLPYLTSSATSDDNGSTITSISSRLDFLNCNKCGHSMSMDSSSMCSSSTVTSSLYRGAGALPYRSRDYLRGRGGRWHGGRCTGGRRMGSRGYPIRKKRTTPGRGRRARGGRDSDDTSTTAYNDCSEA